MTPRIDHEIPTNRNWFGYVTVDNLEAVASAIRRRIGTRKYAFVSSSNGMIFTSQPKVRTSQQLVQDEEQPHVWFETYDDSEKRFGGFWFHDSYGTWGVAASELDTPERRPYVVMEYDHIRIVQLSGSRDTIVWVIAFQEEE